MRVNDVHDSMLNDSNSFVGAIKAVRECTGWGLKDAKDFVEAFNWSLWEEQHQGNVSALTGGDESYNS